MWFKDAMVFQLTRSNFFEQIDLEKLVKNRIFKPCDDTQISSFGFISALPNSENLVHSADNNNFMLLRVQTEQRIVPVEVVKMEVDKKIHLVKTEQLRSVTKREKEQFKEDVIFELLPRAFSIYKEMAVYIDRENELVVVDTNSRDKAENVLALLRSAIGTLPITSYIEKDKLQTLLNHWIKSPKNIEPPFVIGWDAKFVAPGEDGSQASFKNQNLHDEKLNIFIDDNDFEVNQLKIEFDECFSFTFKNDGTFKGIKFFDVLKEQNDDLDGDDVLARIDADFILFGKEMGRFFATLSGLDLVDKIDDKEAFDASNIKYIENIDEQVVDVTQQIKTIKDDLDKKLAHQGVTIESLIDVPDTLYDEAVLFVIDTNRVSISSVQRKFRIGYNRAASIVEQMEFKGVISEPGHNGAREVLGVVSEQ